MDVVPARSNTGPDVAAVAPPGPRRWRPSPYLLLSTVVVLALAVIAARRPWIGDFGLHAAVIERLRADLLHPGNPQVVADTDSPYYTPYTVLLAVVARLTGASAVAVLGVAAPFCVALLLYGLRRFVAVFTDNRWAPVLALVSVPLLWGPDAPAWSGFLTLRGLPLISPYPSTVAMALMLLCWSALAAATRRPAVWRWLLVGLLGVLVVLIHPFTGVCTVLGVLALALGWWRRLGRAQLPGLAAGLLLALVVALGWPYFSVLGMFSAADDFDAIHVALYRDLPAWYGLGFAVGVPAVLLRLRRDRLDPLAWLFLITLLVVAFGGLTDRYALGRVWPVVLLSLQVAVAVELAGLLARAGSRGWRGALRSRDGALTVAAAVVTAAACVAGFSFQYGNLLLVLPKDRLTTQLRAAHQVSRPLDYAWAERRIAAGQVVLSESPDAARVLLRNGARFVTPPWPDPFLPDGAQRAADQAAMLDPATAEGRRRQLLDQYRVDWLLAVSGAHAWADGHAREVVDGPGRRRLLRLR